MAPRLVYKARRSCHFLCILKELRWLPIERRIDEKSFAMTFNARNSVAPSYLAELLRDYTAFELLDRLNSLPLLCQLVN